MAEIYMKIRHKFSPAFTSTTGSVFRLVLRRGPRLAPGRHFSTTAGLHLETSSQVQYITNSLTHQKEQLQMSTPSILRWYSCGPTVYDISHLGHAFSYMQFDLIRRALEEYRGVNVVQVMNITDIDDKIIRKANEMKVDWKEISKKYESEFMEDLRNLGIKSPTVTARVTSFIPEIVQFIQKLITAGTAYVTASGSVYFDTKIYGRYGKFQKEQEIEKFDANEKRSQVDFALWKGAKPGEPSWKVPFSSVPGRPGWHIECSTVASHFFGSLIDLHSGGIDLMFPHHENEEAQCCAYHGVENWSKQWIHAGHVLASDATKMSKSQKNFISIRDFLQKFSADQFRIFCMRHHYRSNCTYDEEEMRIATDIISKFSNFINTVDSYLNGTLLAICEDESEIFAKLDETKFNVESALADDFDFPRALHSLSELVSNCHKQLSSSQKGTTTTIATIATTATTVTTTTATAFTGLAAAANFVEIFFAKFGLILPTKRVFQTRKNASEEGKILPKIMDELIDFRGKVRQAALQSRKESPNLSQTILSSCDTLRINLNGVGLRIKDHGNSSVWEISDFSVKEKKMKNS